MRKVLTKAAAGVFLLASSFVVSAPAASAADLGRCSGPNSGYLCIYDGPKDGNPGRWGELKDSNRYWGHFGWNDRADFFINHGRRCNVGLYQHIDFQGDRKVLEIGERHHWRDEVSSNLWCV